MTDAVARALLARLRARGWTLGVAESLTGGLVVAALVAIPGASTSLRGGVVAYATDLKQTLLGVDEELLQREGAIHPAVARQMAEGARVRLGGPSGPADVGLATTGVAGPELQDGKPVGTVHLAVATPEGSRVRSLALSGTRAEVREAAVSAALKLAADSI